MSARSALLRAIVALILGVVAHAASAEPALGELRIGFQKGSLAQVVLKEQGALERRLPHTRVSWVEFPAGPQLLEALAVGGIDLGATGDTPPIFAQAAGKDLVYVAYETPAPEGSAILVSPQSPIRSLADLRGKRVAFAKGSSAHFFTVQALKQAGLAWSDIHPVYLAPADARAAFEGGSVDAWTIWDPYYADVEFAGKARVLATSKGFTRNTSFYLASGALVSRHPETVAAFLDEINKVATASQQDPRETARQITRILGLSPAVVDRFVSRRPGSAVQPLTPEVIAAQQAEADAFFQLHLIPKEIRVADAVWHPQSASATR